MTANCGACAMILKRAAAGPVGRRRSCSQFCKVFTLTPINRANSDFERLVRSRIARIPEEPTSNRREAFCWQRRIAPRSCRCSVPAQRRSIHQRRFRVMGDAEELARALSWPWDKAISPFSSRKPACKFWDVVQAIAKREVS